MCQVPQRSWRSALRPARLLLGGAAVAAVIGGAIVEGAAGGVLIAVAAALLLAAVTLPVVREVEFGFPSGVKVRAAVQDRAEEFRHALADHRQELSLVANLLCDDPDAAAELVETAWSRSVPAWRGPITPALHLFVLCTLVHRLAARQRWLTRTDATARDLGPLSALTPTQRTAVVLRDFAELSIDQIAEMTGRTVADLAAELAAADDSLAASDVGGSR